MAWILRLVQIGAEGEDPDTDLMEISRPDGLGDIANLGLTLFEAKQLLANVQRGIAAAQASPSYSPIQRPHMCYILATNMRTLRHRRV